MVLMFAFGGKTIPLQATYPDRAYEERNVWGELQKTVGPIGKSLERRPCLKDDRRTTCRFCPGLALFWCGNGRASEIGKDREIHPFCIFLFEKKQADACKLSF